MVHTCSIVTAILIINSVEVAGSSSGGGVATLIQRPLLNTVHIVDLSMLFEEMGSTGDGGAGIDIPAANCTVTG